MKQNQKPRHGRQGRPNQNNNQKRGGKPRHNNANRNQQPTSLSKQVDSRGPGGHQRGNAKQLYEKYKILAQEKRSSDRQESESLMQHADHYYRIYAEFTEAEATKQAQRDKDRAQKTESEQQAVTIDPADKQNEAILNPQPENSQPENSQPENSQPEEPESENSRPVDQVVSEESKAV